MKTLIHHVAVVAAMLLSATVLTKTAMAQARDPKAAGESNADPGPIQIPAGYRDWKLISVAREEGKQDDIRAVLGNDIAIKAYREGTIPFPDGAIIARIAWSLVPSEENNKAFGQEQSFVAGPPKNGLQFMSKDAKKYAATGGWGYAQFGETDGKPIDAAKLVACYNCHQPAAAHDSCSRGIR